ncbi:MAG: magnesium transporter, partial [Gammaproteobacteria bacterium]
MSEIMQQEPGSRVIDQLHKALDVGEFDHARGLLTSLHPSEIADVLEGLPGKLRDITWSLIEPELEGDVLAHIQ